MRTTLATAIVLAVSIPQANATNFWLSPSNASSAPPADVSGIPRVPSSGSVYLWGQTDPDETLQNWSLHVHTGNPGVINFTGVDVLNPKLGETIFDEPPKDVLRYEIIHEPEPTSDGQSLRHMRGLTVANENVIGVGIGPGAATLDPFYDAVNNSWLLAEITYEAIGLGRTDLWLQIGANGLNNSGGGGGDIDVIFGALTDPALNGLIREQDSLTPEAHVVPEPATIFLGALGLLGLVAVLRFDGFH